VFHADGSAAVGPIALVEVQAYVYAAKLAAAELACEFADDGVAVALTTQAELLRARFARAFWMAEHQTFALAIDGAKAQCAVQTSNAGHALFAGIADDEQAAGVAATLLGEAMFSGWGVRTLSIHELRYNPMSYHNGSVWPHDNAMIAEGLARYGHKAEVLRILDAMFDASQALDQRLPELMCGFPRRAASPTRYPVANAPQAWAAGSVFMLLRAALGLHVDATTGLVWFDRPVLPSWLEHLRITRLAVGSEEVDLDLRRSEDGVAVVVTRATGNVEVLTRTP
jgi:glycogen debranching enzyme